MRLHQRTINMQDIELSTKHICERSTSGNHRTMKVILCLAILCVAHRGLQELTLNIQDSSKVFENTKPYLIALAFTMAETLAIVIAFRIENTDRDEKVHNGVIEMKVILLLSHTFSSLFSHLWMGIDKDVYTNAPRYFEPLIAVALCKACYGFSYLKFGFTTIFTTIGLSLMTSPVTVQSLFGRKAILLYLSSALMVLRNIVLKHMHDQSFRVTLSRGATILYFALFGAGITTAMCVFVHDGYLRLLCSIVFLSSIITTVVTGLVWMYLLKVWMPIEVANWIAIISVLNAVIFLQVHLMPNLLSAFIGLTILIFGFTLKRRFASERYQMLDRTVTQHEILTRMEFLVFILFVCGLCVYRFPPSFSHSDEFIQMETRNEDSHHVM